VLGNEYGDVEWLRNKKPTEWFCGYSRTWLRTLIAEALPSITVANLLIYFEMRK